MAGVTLVCLIRKAFLCRSTEMQRCGVSLTLGGGPCGRLCGERRCGGGGTSPWLCGQRGVRWREFWQWRLPNHVLVVCLGGGRIGIRVPWAPGENPLSSFDRGGNDMLRRHPLGGVAGELRCLPVAVPSPDINRQVQILSHGSLGSGEGRSIGFIYFTLGFSSIALVLDVCRQDRRSTVRSERTGGSLC